MKNEKEKENYHSLWTRALCLSNLIISFSFLQETTWTWNYFVERAALWVVSVLVGKNSCESMIRGFKFANEEILQWESEVIARIRGFTLKKKLQKTFNGRKKILSVSGTFWLGNSNGLFEVWKYSNTWNIISFLQLVSLVLHFFSTYFQLRERSHIS